MKADVTGREQSDRIGAGWGRQNCHLVRTESVPLIIVSRRPKVMSQKYKKPL